jgi:ABC-type transporter Mla subunit MlaD
MFDHDRDKDLSELIIKKLDKLKDQADRIEEKLDALISTIGLTPAQQQALDKADAAVKSADASVNKFDPKQ